VDPNLVGDTDLGYDPFLDDDADLRGGFVFPWMNASANSQAHVNNNLRPPPGGGGGGGSGGGGGGVPSTQALHAYAGPNFGSVGVASGYYMIPPDNASAVGANALIMATNGEVQVFSRSGAGGFTLTKTTDISLDNFFGATGTFDPRVIYDPNSGKLIVVAADQNGTGDTSHIWVAVSTDSTATHFNVSSINTAIGVGSGNVLSWADFPQVGLDNAGNLYLTANMFSFSGGSFQGTQLWVVNENSVSTGTPLTPTALDPSTAAGFGGELFSLAPATATGSAGDYLVAYDSARLTNSTHNVLDIVYIDGQGGEHKSIIDVGAIDSNATYGGLTAPQPGTNQVLDADDSRTASVVYKNGYLYVAADILPRSGPDIGHTTVHWWVLSTDANGNPVAVVNQGDISGNTFHSGSNLRSYYGSLAVDDNGNMAVSFSGSGPTNGTNYTGYASAYEVTIANAAHTTTHEVGNWQLVEAGTATYYRTFGGSDNRWGDYSSISLDPSNPGHFWAFNEFATTHGYTISGQNGVWATEMGYF
jgi:hypothetical protein